MSATGSDIAPHAAAGGAFAPEPLDPEIVPALSQAEAFPSDEVASGAVETLQTHISHVFLTRERVYKLRKAVRLPFLDFSTRALREDDCWRELALNRRLAPDVYLGVAPVLREGGRLRVGAPAQQRDPDVGELESCVVMRRLRAGRDALSLLQAGELRATHLERVAGVLADFHAEQGLGVPAPFDPETWRARMLGPPGDCLAVLAGVDVASLDRSLLERISERSQARGHALAHAFEVRRREGRAVDGHGDVHLQHVWFERDDAAPLLIDCIEFDAELRRIDAAAEVAFLAMDLAYRARGDLAEAFLGAYARERDDFGLYDVVDYHVAYRALVRAKVAALAAGDAAIPAAQRSEAEGSADRHLALAERVLEEPGKGRVVVLCGTVGSGKSSVARALAETGGGVVVATDPTRKRLAGLPATDRSGAQRGLYAEEHSERVYRGLLERARPVVEAGRTAVLDGTFSKRSHREEVLRFAAHHDLPACLVEVCCSPEVARERLERRQAVGGDPSDAGPEFLERSLADFEPPTEWPEARRTRLATDAPGGAGLLQDLAPWIDARAGGCRGGLASFVQHRS